MSVRDLIPWGRNSNQTPATQEAGQNPFLSLHRDVNRLFDDMFRGIGLPAAFGRVGAFTAGWPNVEISETDKEIRVFAEIPGLEEKDVEVLLEEGVLTIRGEKKAETEDKERHFSERYYGFFERHVSVGTDVEQDKVGATFRNGVLRITLPKSERARNHTKRIPINAL